MVDGDEVAAAVAGRAGLVGGDSNGSRGGMGPFFLGTKTDMRGGGLDLWGGVVGGGRMILGCLGDEGVE